LTPPTAASKARSLFAGIHAALAAGHPPPGKAWRGVQGAVSVAALVAGYKRGSTTGALRNAEVLLGKSPDWSKWNEAKGRALLAAVKIDFTTEARPSAPAPTADDLLADLRRAKTRGLPVPDERRGMIEELTKRGYAIHEIEPGRVMLDLMPQAAFASGSRLVIESDKNNCFRFGATGDWHVGSQYFRQDVVDDLYSRYAAAGVRNVFHTGNWIEGESRFNKHELRHHSMDGQIDALIHAAPRVKGITTYAVSGDDHEGWYAQREGIDVGRYAASRFRSAGRLDWVDLGYMESHVTLRNKNSGAESVMAVVHPGGGSAYALSYSIQKIIEALDGGEKPAVGLYGHYHKIWAGNIRNVWVVQTGCAQDQTTFMRKKRLSAHVGGALIDLEQDPRTGAIIAMTPKLIRYFVKGYYNGRWKHGSDVTLPERGLSE
jgi:hypothetical protein